MPAPPRPPEPPQTVSLPQLMARLSTEVASLRAAAMHLQDGLHRLPLAATDSPTRRILQTADRLTQSLDCIGTVLAALARMESGVACDLPSLLGEVCLEDLRVRLATGADGRHGRRPPGDVELF